ncbi:MAG: hypothetical protein A2Y33_16610 [Spirochaetes bacterium GWF1_51_8]|nr:MAG: hypothetical protein A2Y33_16610 [Spirochaetes bacterium GWF1_51_8]
MKIKTEEALKINEKYGSEDMPIVFLNDIYVSTNSGVLQISQGMKFDSTQYELLVRGNVLEFEVIFTEKLLAKLITNFPDRYRYPVGRKNLIEIDRVVSGLEDANRASKRKRYMLTSTEIYKKNSRGMFETVLKYGERLTYTRWNEVKVKLSRDTTLDYRFEECGVMVFVMLNPGDPLYAQRFMKNTEIITLLVEHKRDFDITLSPDFNPDTDVYPVNEIDKAFEVYLDKKPRLIIIADELSDDYKAALAKIKVYDRYARMIVIKNPDPANKLEILKLIKRVYNQDPWEQEK